MSKAQELQEFLDKVNEEEEKKDHKEVGGDLDSEAEKIIAYNKKNFPSLF